MHRVVSVGFFLKRRNVLTTFCLPTIQILIISLGLLDVTVIEEDCVISNKESTEIRKNIGRTEERFQDVSTCFFNWF